MSQFQSSRGGREQFRSERPPEEPSEANVLERLLRLIADCAPRPFYPRLYARQTGTPPGALNYYLEQLWLEGLLAKADSGTPESGAGLTLSLAGVRALEDPARLGRLRTGRAVDPGDRGARAREALRNVGGRPTVSLAILGVNVLFFLVGLVMCMPDGAATNAFFIGFLSADAGNTRADEVRQATGALSAADLARGQWWRLLTCCFVHFGIIHLGMNMFALYQLGRQMERLLDWWRYLIIYLLAGLGGSWLAILFRPEIHLAGASGAICGIFGSEVVWVLLHKRYLPQELSRRWTSNLVINGIMLTFFSLMPGVSALGHLGGFVVGAGALLLLTVQRESRSPLRWASVAVLAALPLLFWATLRPVVLVAGEQQEKKQAEAREKKEKAEAEERERKEKAEAEERRTEQRKAFEKDFLPRIRQTADQGIDVYLKQFKPTARKAPAQRDQAGNVRQAMATRRNDLSTLADELEKAGPYEDETAEKARARGITYTREVKRLLERAEDYLAREQTGVETLEDQEIKVSTAKKDWEDLLKK
jgi:rhomboid protease GluP